MAQKINYSYEQIHQLIKKKTEDVKEFEADYMIAISGGGLIPARILRNYIKVPILTVSLKLYDDNDNIQNEVKFLRWLDNFNLEAIKDKRILIVDEVDDTRKTLVACYNKLKESEPKDIAIFTVHNKNKEKLGTLPKDVQYFACQEIQDEWVVYPWDHV